MAPSLIQFLIPTPVSKKCEWLISLGPISHSGVTETAACLFAGAIGRR
jgi:hypothetical protein